MSSKLEVKELADASFEENSILRKTTSIRLAIVDNLVSQGLPSDPAAITLLTDSLSNLEKVAIGRLRVKSQDKQTDAVANTKNIVANLLDALNRNKGKAHSDITEEPVAKLPDSIPEPVLVPGETSTTRENMDYSSFMLSVGRES